MAPRAKSKPTASGRGRPAKRAGAVRHALRKVDELVDSLPQIVFEIDADGTITYANRTAFALFGYAPGELAHGLNYNQMVVPHQLERLAQNVQNTLQGQPSSHNEYTALRKDGSTFPVCVFYSAPVIKDGKPVGLRGILVDITDRKKLEEQALAVAFAGGHQLYQDLFERSNEGITIIADRVVRYCNPSLARMVGRTVDDLVGTPFTDHIHPDELPKVAGFYRMRMEGGTPPPIYEAALRHKDGHRIEVEINAGAIPFEGRTADFVFIRDISESKWTEEVLRQSENLYRALFESSGTPMIFVEEDTTISLANREFEKLSGYSKQEVEGKMKWTRLVADPGELERMQEYHRLRRQGPELAPSSYEFGLAQRQGTVRQVAVTVVVMPGTKKSLASFLDVTERNRAEQALRTSEERFRAFFENTFLGIYRTTPDGRIIMANPALLKMLDFKSFEELASHNLEDESLESARERAEFKHKMERDGQVIDHEATWRRRDGAELRVRENARCVRGPEGEVLYYEGAVEDITEQKRAEEKTRELQLQLENILESTKTGLDIIDTHFNLRFVDQGWQKVYGPYEGRKCYEYFMDRHQPCPSCGIPQAFETHRPVVSEEYLPKEDRFIQVTSIPFQDKGGEWLVSEVNVDITERRRAGELIQESENRYRTIFENSGAATIIIEADTTIAIANAEFAKWAGYPREELEGKMSWTRFVDPEDLVRMKKYHAERRQDGSEVPRNYDFRFVDRWGGCRDCNITVAMIPGSTRSVASVLDITDRKRAEAELKKHQENLEELVGQQTKELKEFVVLMAESEEKHRLLLNSIKSPILALDGNMKVIYCNTAYATLVGKASDEIQGRNPFEIFPVFRQTQTFDAYQRVLETGQPQDVEGRMGERWLHAKVFRTPWGILSIADDVTEQKLAQQGLQESERRLRDIIDAAPFGAHLYELVPDGRLVFAGANRAADDILHLDHGQMIGLTIEQAFPGWAQTEIPERYRQVAATGQRFRDDQVGYDSGGISGVYEVNAFQTGPGRMAVFFRDVTERRQAELLRSALYEISDSVGSLEALDSFWPVLHRVIGKLLPADNFYVALFDQQKGRVSFPYFVDEFDPNPGEKRLGQGLTDEVLRTGRPLLLKRGDFDQTGTASKYDIIGTPCHSWIGVPLKAGDRTFGAVVVQSYSQDIVFGEREQQAVNYICQRVAAAIVNRQAEGRTRENERKFRGLFEQSNDAIIVHDILGNIHDVNSQACRMFGYERQDFLGHNLGAIVPPGSQLMPRQAFMQVVRRGSARFESQFQTADGDLIDIEVSSSLVDRDRRWFQSILRDITERKVNQAAIQESEQRFRSLYEQSNDAIIVHDIRGKIIDVNPAACALFGYGRDKFITMMVQDLPPPGEYPIPMRALMRILRKGSVRFDSRFRKPDGTILEADVSSSVVDKERRIFQSIIRDITERKQAKEYNEMGREVLQILNEPGNLQDSIQRIIATLKTRTGVDAVGIRLQDGDDFPYLAQQGFSREFLLTENTLTVRAVDGGVCRDKDGNVSLECTCGLVISGKTDPANPIFTTGGSCWTNDSFSLLDIPPGEDPRLHPRNQCIHQGYASVSLVPIRNKDRIVGLIHLNDRRKGRFALNTVEILESIASHIGEALMRKRTEADLIASEQRFRRLFEQSIDAIVVHDIDGNIKDTNNRFCEMLGYDRERLLRMNVSGLPPEGEALISKYAFQKVVKKGSVRFESRFRKADGALIDVDISTSIVDPELRIFQSIVRDITERKRAQHQLKQTTEELARSNQELEMFAYVASHDLQEPLRMVASYIQLLERRYKDKLDGDALEFIGYAVDGAVRMRTMINDLLNYSRVTTKGQPFGPVSMEKILADAQANLTVAIEESQAEVAHDPLPEVLADATQMTQLLQNLIGNAIKFHGPEPPRIRVSVKPSQDEWLFSVQDNGIGIDPKYNERIFLIFQRLHTREEYPGTGIGLAVCKKIVERHGGRIWLQSQPGAGTTFFFTLAGQAPEAGAAALGRGE